MYTAAAEDYSAKRSNEAAGNVEEYQSIFRCSREGMSNFDEFQDGWESDAFKSCLAWVDGLMTKFEQG